MLARLNLTISIYIFALFDLHSIPLTNKNETLKLSSIWLYLFIPVNNEIEKTLRKDFKNVEILILIVALKCMGLLYTYQQISAGCFRINVNTKSVQ